MGRQRGGEICKRGEGKRKVRRRRNSIWGLLRRMLTEKDECSDKNEGDKKEKQRVIIKEVVDNYIYIIKIT